MQVLLVPYLQPCMQDMYGDLQPSPNNPLHMYESMTHGSLSSPLPPLSLSSATSQGLSVLKATKIVSPSTNNLEPFHEVQILRYKPAKQSAYCEIWMRLLTAIFNQVFYCFKKEQKNDKKRLTEPDFRLYLFPPVHNV